ncbi:cilia- and flagella-associated protein 91-like [Brachionichthys hirsutus]|uniref:cilia- and flagella-associated protein 91-like n=1 Tax=Brachionichthys hirsutus TaxID=412623 RepID=UPI003604F831
MTAFMRGLPKFGLTFTNLAPHPACTLHVDPADPVPASGGPTGQGFNPNTRSWMKREECHVTGADRWKYFNRPLIPYSHQLPPDVIFALPREDYLSTFKDNAEQQPTHFTVGVQTDYRESETQTDPYSPEYAAQPGTTPSELLQLAALTWGHGLPAGLAEVELIQRARAKRAWEATLPPLNDLSQRDKRRSMMEEMEAAEWAFREGEIQKLQEARLAAWKDLLNRRDEAQKEVTRKRLDQVYSQHLKEKGRRQQKICNDCSRALRKLEAKRRNEKAKIEQLGRVRYNTDPKTYAPRDISTNRNPQNFGLKSYYLDTYEGLLKLEAGLSDSIREPQVKKPQPKVSREVIRPPPSAALKVMNKYEVSEKVREKPIRCLVKKEKPVPRPVSPRVEAPPEGEEDKELAVIHLQKLLRGRRVQYEMFVGKNNHMELIQELRTVHALQGEEQILQKADEEFVLSLKQQRDKFRHKMSLREASRAGLVGAELENLFDTLSKDLIRLQEERRIHAFTLLAERDRRLREAEESGRRQVEERRRREEDEIFRQVVQVQQETVDLYLEDIILETLEQTADQQAREEIHRRAKEVNSVAEAMEESRNNLQSEEIVSELVYSFLIPEIQKISARQKVHQRQQRHLEAAQSILQGAAEHPGAAPIVGVSVSTCPDDGAAKQILEEVESSGEKERSRAELHSTQEED